MMRYLGEKRRALADEMRPLGLEHHDVEVLHHELRSGLEQRGTIVLARKKVAKLVAAGGTSNHLTRSVMCLVETFFLSSIS